MEFSPNQYKVWNYITKNDGKDFTAQDIAYEIGFSVQLVCAIVTLFQKKGYTIREEFVSIGGKGKFIRLTKEGRAIKNLI